MSTTNVDKQLLDPEFEHAPVPKEYRKRLSSVAAVWFGFPMVLTSAVIGGLITAQLGFKAGALAMLVGNLLLFLMVGLLSYDAGRTGMNFSLTAQKTFGRSGYYLVSGLLSTVVIGWFALQVGLTGATMHGSFGANLLWMTVLGGILYVAVTYIGIKALSFLGWIAAPFYILIAIIAIVMAVKSGNSDIFGYHPHVSGAMSFGAAVTLVFAGFADSGTMTADFTRWAKNGREGALSTIFAFPIGNFIAEIVGGIVVATGVIPNPTSTGGDFMSVLAGHGPLLTILSILFVFINLGSVGTHCLYNGAVGWSHMTGKKMRTITLIIGVLGLIVAISGIYNHFFNWLVLLGVIIPPIGSIIIMDRLVLRKSESADLVNWRPLAFIVWVLSAAISLFVNFYAPHLSVAVVGLVTAAIFYSVGNMFVKGSSGEDTGMNKAV
ncbi:purine-cytosine permease family protein [Bacillus sp. 1NLA3E]|uniref:purine-cytosine permease family protein n=1 Tax=Bacillus sp. 1NLA3E TaxID=666686 RepID=UPI000247EB64|nr:cytosine permease [Bacillus sp. 1NLA3E]AGK52375.1 cytosine/purines uracil thiamine allantoin permease [Bacillus sp. 1NLA3E]